MTGSDLRYRWTHLVFAGMLAFGSLASTGCQVDLAGQTLPSPYYLSDDVQYFPAGSEFKLSNEAAAMRAYQEQTEP